MFCRLFQFAFMLREPIAGKKSRFCHMLLKKNGNRRFWRHCAFCDRLALFLKCGLNEAEKVTGIRRLHTESGAGSSPVINDAIGRQITISRITLPYFSLKLCSSAISILLAIRAWPPYIGTNIAAASLAQRDPHRVSKAGREARF